MFNVVLKYECKLAELKGLHLGEQSQTENEQIGKASLGGRVGGSERLRVGS